MGNVLEVRDLIVRYHDGTEALHGVDLTVQASERVGLIGPNGAGKTSLLLAVLRGVPFEGTICVDGVELTRRQVSHARSQVGITFQNAEDQLFMATLLDDVAFGPLNQGLPADQAAAAATAAIAAVGLSGLEHRPAHHLSGGQKRAASLATVLSMDVKLLLLDEPASDLDFRSRRRLLEILTGRAEAMVLATHDLELVARLCSRVVVLDEGRIAAEGPAESILNDKGLLGAHGLA